MTDALCHLVADGNEVLDIKLGKLLKYLLYKVFFKSRLSSHDICVSYFFITFGVAKFALLLFIL